MQAERRPTVTDEVIAINDDLEINYGVFRNDFTAKVNFPNASTIAIRKLIICFSTIMMSQSVL